MPVIDTDVKAIIDTDRDTTPFIATAKLLTSEILSGSGLSSERIDAVTRYLAAHFVWLTESSGLISKEVGGAKEVYHTYAEKNTGLASSRYGQTALSLDTSGSLAKATANNGMKALFNVIPQHGNPPSWWPGWVDFPVV